MDRLNDIEREIEKLKLKAELIRNEQSATMRSIYDYGRIYLDIDMTPGRINTIQDIEGLSGEYIATYNNHVMRSLWMRLPAKFTMPKHRHMAEEEIIVLCGSIEMEVDGVTHVAERGQTILIRSMQLHSFTCSERCEIVSNLYSVGQF